MFNFIRMAFLFSALTLLTVSGIAGSNVSSDLNNAVLITDVIRPATMRTRIQELSALRDSEDKQNVDIILNSPGGEVHSTLQFISVMEQIKAQGRSIRCIVINGAASAAFQILAHCSERVGLSYGFLLWHPVRQGLGFGAALTPSEAVNLANSLLYVESILLADLRPHLDISDDDFMMHYNLETLHTVISLHSMDPKFIDPIQQIENIAEITEKAIAQQKKDKETLMDELFGQGTGLDYTAPEGVLIKGITE